MPRKPNYNFDKRQKELKRQSKKDAKLAEKLRNKQERAAEPKPNDVTE